MKGLRRKTGRRRRERSRSSRGSPGSRRARGGRPGWSRRSRRWLKMLKAESVEEQIAAAVAAGRAGPQVATRCPRSIAAARRRPDYCRRSLPGAALAAPGRAARTVQHAPGRQPRLGPVQSRWPSQLAAVRDTACHRAPLEPDHARRARLSQALYTIHHALSPGLFRVAR